MTLNDLHTQQNYEIVKKIEVKKLFIIHLSDDKETKKKVFATQVYTF